MRFVIPAGPPRRRTAAAVAALFAGWLSGLGPGAANAGWISAGAAARPAARPHRAPAAVRSTPQATPKVDCRAVKCVALTFDDGPGPYTAKLLGMLAAHHTKVTFFLIGGSIRGREAIVRKEVSQGHAIGDHTWTHPQLTTLSDGAIRSQLIRTLREIHQATGGTTHLMRPPYGATNSRVGDVTRKLGMAQILWSVDTNDWRDRNAKIVAHRAIYWAHRNDIILMHDIHPTTVNAVPKILSGLSRRGFTLVTVPQLLAGRPLKPGKVYLSGG
jgi:peptidoglycan/xylan/chitin deacetylase (PgdA/CDA1 family)